MAMQIFSLALRFELPTLTIWLDKPHVGTPHRKADEANAKSSGHDGLHLRE
jgi:hypothetical protein